MYNTSKSNGKGFILVFVTTQFRGKKCVAPTYLFWHLDSKKMCHDVVYYDFVFIVCVSLWPISAEGWIMYDVQCHAYKIWFFFFFFWVETAAWHPLPHHPWVLPCMRQCYECWKARWVVNVYIILFTSRYFCCACAIGTVAWNFKIIPLLFSNFQHWLRPLVLNHYVPWISSLMNFFDLHCEIQ
jgi:hypothetical protein